MKSHQMITNNVMSQNKSSWAGKFGHGLQIPGMGQDAGLPHPELVHIGLHDIPNSLISPGTTTSKYGKLI